MTHRPLPKAQVKPMRVVARMAPDAPHLPESPQWVAPRKKSFVENLTRNVAVAAALLLFVVALRSSAALPDAQSVFHAVVDSVTMDLDETLGKLTFVSNLLPESALVFWNSTQTVQVMAPVQGNLVHPYTKEEPYIGLMGLSPDIRAAASGQVMSIAHGDGEERAIRLRHENGLETIYGNLTACFVQEGDQVYQGDLLGETKEDHPLFFEMRKDGRSLDPTSLMREAGTTP